MNTPIIHPAAWLEAWRQGDESIFDRLSAEAKATDTCLPATTYAEALGVIAAVVRFPRFMPGPEQSATTHEYLTPLLIDAIHLAVALADPSVDALEDIAVMIGTKP